MSNNDLYRLEALQHASERTLGSPMISQPFTTRALTILLLLITAVALLFLSQAQYARKETVSGYLRPDRGISRVYPRNQGVADTIYVKEGDYVKKGAPLVNVRAPYSLSSGEQASANILMEIELQKGQLKNRITREKEKTALELNWQQKNIASFEDELMQLKHLQDLQAARALVSSLQMAAAKELHQQGFLSNMQWLSSKVTSLAEQKEVVQIRQRITQKKSMLKAANHQLALLPTLVQDQLDLLDREYSLLKQRETEQRERSSHLVIAPITGKITAVSVSIGDSVSNVRSMLSIVPEGAQLYAWLLIPSRAAGLSEDGQRVRLMYDSFPYQQFGTQPGTIISISDAVIEPNDISGPLRPGEPVFIAKVALDKDSIIAYGIEKPLQIDMLLSADIVQAQRSILEWMLNPLFALRGRTG
ncbi:MAG: HlyD family efflux transporter periplasmic adaptor subunit [Pseudomonadales bacterium]